MTRKQRPKGSGNPRPNRTPVTAAAWPAIASQRSRTRVSRRSCRALRVRFVGLISTMTRQDRVFEAFAKQFGEQDFPIPGHGTVLRMLLKHKKPARSEERRVGK